MKLRQALIEQSPSLALQRAAGDELARMDYAYRTLKEAYDVEVSLHTELQQEFERLERRLQEAEHELREVEDQLSTAEEDLHEYRNVTIALEGQLTSCQEESRFSLNREPEYDKLLAIELMQGLLNGETNPHFLEEVKKFMQ